MKRADFSAVVASVPVSRTAGLVTGSGVHWAPAKKNPDGFFRADAPPRLRKNVRFTDPMRDLHGKKIGDLTVIGVWADKKANNRGVPWVVRCVCGYYEIRRSASFRQGVRNHCSHCDYLKELKAGNIPARTLQEIKDTGK